MNTVIRHHVAIFFLGLTGFLALASGALHAGVSAIDDEGNPVELAAPASRIISLAPHATELLYSAGAGRNIAATVAHSDYPAAAQALPRVGDAANLDFERILQLDPDLIVAWESGLPASQLARLRALGIPVFLSQPDSLEAIAASIENLGKLAGTRTQADASAAAFREELARLSHAYADNATSRVFYQIWEQPLMTVNGDHLISQVIALCGGQNVFADLQPLVPRISREAVLKQNPEVILVSAAVDHPDKSPGQWAKWQSLAAVRDQRVHYVPWSEISRPTVRMLNAVDHICGVLR